MTNQEILTKAIEKAIAGGWKPEATKLDAKILLGNGSEDLLLRLAPVVIYSHDFAKALWGEYEEAIYDTHNIPAKWRSAPQVLGYRDFQSIPDELWRCLNCGEDWTKCSPPFAHGYPCTLLSKGNYPGWEVHLKQMVIATDPIAYLGADI